MAGYRQHMAVAAACGVGYAAAGITFGHFDWGLAFLGAGLCTLGGFLPDLDSGSGVAVRELFGLAAAASFVLLIPRFENSSLTTDQMLAILAGIYLFVRYILADYFKHMTVHRGMFHSIPAMFIAGLTVFMLYHNGGTDKRAYLAGAVTIGFLSHLVLDEIWAINLDGMRIRFNQFSGSALKMSSSSLSANIFTYLILITLALFAWLSF